jgi:hypothetical protein
VVEKEDLNLLTAIKVRLTDQTVLIDQKELTNPQINQVSEEIVI